MDGGFRWEDKAAAGDSHLALRCWQVCAMPQVHYRGVRVLGEVKLTHQSIELNKLIAEVKDSPGKLAAIYKKISNTDSI